MEFLKVSCAQCSQYRECTQKTRFFVNYCGTYRQRVKEDVKKAIEECRTRRGHLFTKGFITESHIINYEKAALLTVSP
jgi:hypothetical protein